MNKPSKPKPAPAASTPQGTIQAISNGKKATPPAQATASAPTTTSAEQAAKDAAEAAERDRKLDLVLHRFAKLL
jgi:hypothetical protein